MPVPRQLRHEPQSVDSKSVSMIITKEGWAVLKHDTLLSRWIEQDGVLNAHVDSSIATLVEPGNSVVDVGAALGDHTIVYAERVGPTGKVYAFEPNPIQFECLRHNMRNFPQVELCDCALGSVSGMAKMVLDANVSASHLNHVEGGDIEVITLDDFLCGLPVHFIKLDVEGDELAVLAGAKNTLAKWRPKMLIEIHAVHLHRIGRSAKDILDVLDSLKYKHRPFIGEYPSGQYDLLAEP